MGSNELIEYDQSIEIYEFQPPNWPMEHDRMALQEERLIIRSNPMPDVGHWP